MIISVLPLSSIDTSRVARVVVCLGTTSCVESGMLEHTPLSCIDTEDQ